MSDTTHLFPLGEEGPCACSQLRRAARKITAIYDHALQPAGISITQHALLVNVARAGEISRTALATKLGMDRTTLTRNLMPLEKLGLLVPAKSKDRRERLIQLSAKGLRKVHQSFELWRTAQRSFTSEMGVAKLKQFREVLRTAEEVAEKVSG
jgi:DNA-binding MarR family transcriptional regulator